MSKTYKFTFLSEKIKQVVSIEECNVWSDVVYYNKFLELKLPNAGRARLLKVLHKDLAVEVRNKIRLLSDEGVTEFDIDSIYSEVLLVNTKKYFVSKGSVETSETTALVKRIYSDGNSFFYKDQDQEEWIELISLGKSPTSYYDSYKAKR